MNQDTWSKSLLVGYNYLPIVAKCIDASNMQMALGSFSYQGNALDLMEKMIANNKRKRALINAKVIVDTTLEMLKERNREVLRLRYIKRKSFEQIAAIMNICPRSVFRWHDVAIKQFSSMCILRGYDENSYGRKTWQFINQQRQYFPGHQKMALFRPRHLLPRAGIQWMRRYYQVKKTGYDRNLKRKD